MLFTQVNQALVYLLIISAHPALASVFIGGVIFVSQNGERKATGQENFLKLIIVEVKNFFWRKR